MGTFLKQVVDAPISNIFIGGLNMPESSFWAEQKKCNESRPPRLKSLRFLRFFKSSESQLCHSYIFYRYLEKNHLIIKFFLHRNILAIFAIGESWFLNMNIQMRFSMKDLISSIICLKCQLHLHRKLLHFQIVDVVAASRTRLVFCDMD